MNQFEHLFDISGLSLDRLRSFLKVAEAGNLATAAQGDAVRQSQYSRQIKEKSPAPAFVLCLANGALQGYVVTEAAAAEGGYEAANSVFPPEAGQLMVRQALELIETLQP